MENITVHTKIGADKSAENTQNTSKIFSQICLPKPKSLRIKKKLSLGVRSQCTYDGKTVDRTDISQYHAKEIFLVGSIDMLLIVFGKHLPGFGRHETLWGFHPIPGQGPHLGA
jgi:hypothetical protein